MIVMNLELDNKEIFQREAPSYVSGSTPLSLAH